ncbi:MAG: LPS-assembly protein LptD [Sphingomonadales bacterium]|nr:MAG: LPS-assembly protein LptD [Sphingomonadales bacterium]TNF04087.1 MAG: LPS-assembly protein LptD [Sphingomonadales bacterium]
MALALALLFPSHAGATETAEPSTQQATDSSQQTPPVGTSAIKDVRQPTQAQDSAASTAPDTPLPTSDEEIAFSADTLLYDSDNDVVTASGQVQMLRQGNRLRADEVIWNRKTGEVRANGTVSITDADGNIGYGDSVEVTDTLKDGMVENLLLVMAEGGRLVARHGERKDGLYTLSEAAYSPCPVENGSGCPKQPSWQIKAVRVFYDPVAEKVTYHSARLELFGVPLMVLPRFSHPVGDKGGSGLLVPDIRISGVNGLELALPYYLKLAPNRDLTITPHVFTGELPMLESNYRAFLGQGAYSITGYITNSRRSTSTDSDGTTSNSEREIRGYIDASGTYRFDENWSLTGSLRRVTDRTFLRRYDISRDDRLRSTLKAERIGENSYLSIAGWAVQTLRLSDTQGQMPVALPVIDYRLRLADPVLGGRVQLQANSLALSRSDGQDTQRAFASAQWTLRRLTQMGQELTLTGYLRGDVYHSTNNDLADYADYSGRGGWQTRGIATVAVDMRWPFIGSFLGGTQRIIPRVQVVASPRLKNTSLPNEDARTVDLEDSNLFALNRFPGYDRVEDSTRITVGVEYGLDLRNFTLSSIVGQSYRVSRRPTLLPDGTGLSERVSDIVGRTTLRYRDRISITHRFRLDKDSLAVRRNEIDASFGSHRTYAMVGYLRLNRNAVSNFEGLSDREEIRLGARLAFARYWSLFGSTVIDLTGKKEDPLSDADGYEPVRHRLGIAYQDECIDIGLTWKRNYQSTGDARNNNTVQLRLAFRNLGI